MRVVPVAFLLTLAIVETACAAAKSPSSSPSPPRSAKVARSGLPPDASATVAPPLARPQRFLDPGVRSPWTFPDAAKRKERAQRLATKLSAQLDGEHDRATTGTGFAFALVVDGEVVLLKAKGLADLENTRVATPDTIYRVASLTKAFTATAVMMLRDEGKLATSDLLASHMPELDVEYPHRDDAPIRIEQVLTHSAGLARSGPYAELPRASTEADIASAMKLPLTIDPGVGHRYSNFGFGILGVMVGRKARMPYRDFVRSRLLEPLRMTSSGYDVALLPSEHLAVSYKRDGSALAPVTNGAGEGAGGLYSSARDMAEWIRFQLAAWPPRDDPDDGPVKRATLREMHAPHLPFSVVQAADHGATTTSSTRAHAVSVGLAWEVTRGCYFERLVGHDGNLNGFQSAVRFDVDRNLGFVLLGNSEAANLPAVTERILDTIATDDLLASRRREPAPALVGRVEQAVKRLGPRWTEDDLAQTFSAAFRSQLALSEASALGDRISKEVGSCTYARADVVTDALDAELVFRCTRGILRASARGTGDPVRLVRFEVDVMTPATDEHLTIAKAIALRMQSRDDAALATTLQTKAVASSSKLLLEAGTSVGTCKVAGGDVSPWSHAASFQLSCTKTRATLRLHQRPSGSLEILGVDTPTKCQR